jgi:hypothetical protein
MNDRLITLLTDKGTKASAEIAHALIKTPSKVDLAIEGLNSGKAKIKYGLARALLMLSEQKPEILYPFFDKFVELLSGKNNILKWTAIDIICNLSFVDTGDKINNKILNDFFHLITGDSLITAGHVVGNLWKIVVNEKHPADKIAVEMLKYDQADISDECKCILSGHVLDSFSKFFDLLGNNKKKEVLIFADAQTSSTRGGTRRKANTFNKRFAISGN